MDVSNLYEVDLISLEFIPVWERMLHITITSNITSISKYLQKTEPPCQPKDPHPPELMLLLPFVDLQLLCSIFLVEQFFLSSKISLIWCWLDYCVHYVIFCEIYRRIWYCIFVGIEVLLAVSVMPQNLIKWVPHRVFIKSNWTLLTIARSPNYNLTSHFRV